MGCQADESIRRSEALLRSSPTTPALGPSCSIATAIMSTQTAPIPPFSALAAETLLARRPAILAGVYKDQISPRLDGRSPGSAFPTSWTGPMPPD